MLQIQSDNEYYCNLWTSFIKGDNDAFSEIYKSSYKDLYSYGLSFNISKDQIRDIIQDLFIKIYSKPELIKNAYTLRAFLFTAIRNATINSIKAEQKYSRLDIVNIFEVKYSVNESCIEDNEEQERIKEIIKNILSQLTVRQREIIYLRFLHQMEYEEISNIMNITEQAARNLTHRAIDKVRKENPDFRISMLFVLVLHIYY